MATVHAHPTAMPSEEYPPVCIMARNRKNWFEFFISVEDAVQLAQELAEAIAKAQEQP